MPPAKSQRVRRELADAFGDDGRKRLRRGRVVVVVDLFRARGIGRRAVGERVPAFRLAARLDGDRQVDGKPRRQLDEAARIAGGELELQLGDASVGVVARRSAARSRPGRSRACHRPVAERERQRRALDVGREDRRELALAQRLGEGRPRRGHQADEVDRRAVGLPLELGTRDRPGVAPAGRPLDRQLPMRPSTTHAQRAPSRRGAGRRVVVGGDDARARAGPVTSPLSAGCERSMPRHRVDREPKLGLDRNGEFVTRSGAVGQRDAALARRRRAIATSRRSRPSRCASVIDTAVGERRVGLPPAARVQVALDHQADDAVVAAGHLRAHVGATSTWRSCFFWLFACEQSIITRCASRARELLASPRCSPRRSWAPCPRRMMWQSSLPAVCTIAEWPPLVTDRKWCGALAAGSRRPRCARRRGCRS